LEDGISQTIIKEVKLNPKLIPFARLTTWLQNCILNEGTDLGLTGSFIHYLTDLHVLTLSPPDSYFVSNKPDTVLNETLTADIFLSILEKESDTKNGFAIGYFLRSKIKGYSPKNLPNIFQEKTEVPVKKSIFSAPVKASDLSNLQIVKKVGKQLLPFLELENKYISCLRGENVSKEDAKRLFQHILPQIKEKGKPKEWEQLSRRRHKY
jgi:hypothetical protein